MKTFFCLFIAFFLLLASFSQSIIFLHYTLNKTYYATVLCENKAKPAMHCNGHCKMAKELKAQEKKEQSPFSPKEKQEVVQDIHQLTERSFQSFSVSSKQYFVLAVPILPKVSFSIFHPPTV